LREIWRVSAGFASDLLVRLKQKTFFVFTQIFPRDMKNYNLLDRTCQQTPLRTSGLSLQNERNKNSTQGRKDAKKKTFRNGSDCAFSLVEGQAQQHIFF
jgi:hypothetical protein